MTELLERAEALKTLQQLLQEARTRGRVALVAGEAGIGKSTLLEATAAAHGTVWWGRCDALETPLPLAPWLDIARERGPRFAGLLPGPRPMLFAAVLDELRAAWARRASAGPDDPPWPGIDLGELLQRIVAERVLAHAPLIAALQVRP